MGATFPHGESAPHATHMVLQQLVQRTCACPLQMLHLSPRPTGRLAASLCCVVVNIPSVFGGPSVWMRSVIALIRFTQSNASSYCRSSSKNLSTRDGGDLSMLRSNRFLPREMSLMYVWCDNSRCQRLCGLGKKRRHSAKNPSLSRFPCCSDHLSISRATSYRSIGECKWERLKSMPTSTVHMNVPVNPL